MTAFKSPTTALEEVIRASSFKTEEGVYIYTRVKKVIAPEQHLLVIHDDEEITVVTKEENISLLGEHESNKDKWKLINIRCGKPFYCVGFIAYITDALAREGIDIVITSSFTNDLILVIEKDFDLALRVLVTIGFKRR